jgi:hypothetical protein
MGTTGRKFTRQPLAFQVVDLVVLCNNTSIRVRYFVTIWVSPGQIREPSV